MGKAWFWNVNVLCMWPKFSNRKLLSWRKYNNDGLVVAPNNKKLNLSAILILRVLIYRKIWEIISLI